MHPSLMIITVLVIHFGLFSMLVNGVPFGRIIHKRSTSDHLSKPFPYNTWGEYCRMKNPFHPRCRGIAVQKLIEVSVEQMDPEHQELYREFLIGYIIGKYPNVVRKLLNHQILRQLILVDSNKNYDLNEPSNEIQDNLPIIEQQQREDSRNQKTDYTIATNEDHFEDV